MGMVLRAGRKQTVRANRYFRTERYVVGESRALDMGWHECEGHNRWRGQSEAIGVGVKKQDDDGGVDRDCKDEQTDDGRLVHLNLEYQNFKLRSHIYTVINLNSFNSTHQTIRNGDIWRRREERDNQPDDSLETEATYGRRWKAMRQYMAIDGRQTHDQGWRYSNILIS